MKDKEIIEKIQKEKDLSYYDKLYKKYYPKVSKIVYYRIRNENDCEDITSVIFHKIYEELKNDRFRGDSQFNTWLYTIVRNECNLYYRKSKKLIEKEEFVEKEEFERKITNNYKSAEQEILGKEDAQRKKDFLVDKLEDIEKREILQKTFEDRTFEELEQFYDSISGLNENYQKIVFLFLDGKSMKETAEILEIKLNNLYKKFF